MPNLAEFGSSLQLINGKNGRRIRDGIQEIFSPSNCVKNDSSAAIRLKHVLAIHLISLARCRVRYRGETPFWELYGSLSSSKNSIGPRKAYHLCSLFNNYNLGGLISVYTEKT